MLIYLGRFTYVLKDIIWSLEYSLFQLPSDIINLGLPFK